MIFFETEHTCVANTDKENKNDQHSRNLLYLF